MASIDNTGRDVLATPANQKILGLVSGIAMLLVVAGSLWVMIPQFFINLDRLIAGHPYVSFNAWDIPFFLAVPIFIILAFGIGLRLTNKATEKRIQHAMKFALIFGAIATSARFIYGFTGSQFIAELGYTSCWSLSSPSLMAPTVYVKKSSYCLDNVGHVRKDLLVWMDDQAILGQSLDQVELQKEADRLLVLWDEENSF